MTLRKTTSLTTLISFILLLFSSVILYVTPQGKIAYWANWDMLGLGKEQWGALHTNLGILFIVAGIIHTVLNWKPIVTYLKNKTQKIKVFTADFNLALGISLVIVLFTLFELPPIIGIQHFNESLKEAAAATYGEPPYGHAEVSPLKTFCKRTGLDVMESVAKLKEAGIKGASAEATLAELAEANGKTPQQIYSLIQPTPVANTEMPEHPRSGFGRKTLTQVCSAYGLDETAMVSALNQQGIQCSAGESMKLIGEKNDSDPHAIYEAMLQLQ